MSRLSRRLEAIAALDYKNYEEWKKDFDEESKIDYQALFAPFLSAKKFTVNSVRRFFTKRDCYEKRLTRLMSWAEVDWAKVVQQTPDEVRHPQLLVQERFRCFENAIQQIKNLMCSKIDEIIKIAENTRLSMKIKAELEYLIRQSSHIISYEEYKSIMVCHVSEDRLIHSAAALANIGVERKKLSQKLAVAQVARIVNQRYELAKACHYTSSLEATFVPRGLPVSIYKPFLSRVRQHVHKFHKYVEIVKNAKKPGALEADWFKRSSWYFCCERKPTLEDAIRLSVAACTPLGAEYTNALYEGLRHHWVETKKIREDYSKGFLGWAMCNFGGILRVFYTHKDPLGTVSTIIHEAGHCMHSLLLHPKGLSLGYADPLVKEAVAKCNECLLWYELLQRNPDQRAQAYLCCRFLNDTFRCLFIDAIYAELELFRHEVIEKGLRLSFTSVMEKLCELVRFYFGEENSISSEFLWNGWIGLVSYLNQPFRAYDEALAAAAAMALAIRIMQGGKRERDDYLAMLKSNPLLGPVTVLSKGGVDLTSLSWVDEIMNSFDLHIDTLDRYLKAQQPMLSLPERKDGKVVCKRALSQDS